MIDPNTTPGLQFAPTNQNAGDLPTQPSGSSPIQSAIQLLSLRLPHVVGAGSLAPNALLSGPGMGGLGGGGGLTLEEILRRMGLGGGGLPNLHAPGAMMPGMSVGGGIPGPSVTPGTGMREPGPTPQPPGIVRPPTPPAPPQRGPSESGGRFRVPRGETPVRY